MGKLLNDLKNSTSHSLDYLLKNSKEETLSKKGITIRKLLAPILRIAYKSQSEYKFILDSKENLPKTKKGKIFIVNHRQSDDMVFSALAVGKSGYFVFGNPTLACESLKNGFGLWAYGMILLKRDDKENRQACYEKMKYVLENGENIIIFPEGYWNLSDDGEADKKHSADSHNSENWLIQDFNIGAFRLSQEIGCDIVPVVLHYDELFEKKCYAKRGKTFNILKSDDVFQKKNEILIEMHTMKYELMAKYSSYSRKKLEQIYHINLKSEWEKLKDKLIKDCNIDNCEVNYRLDLADEKIIGKAKVATPVITEKEVFECLDHINITKENAYVLAKTKNKELKRENKNV